MMTVQILDVIHPQRRSAMHFLIAFPVVSHREAGVPWYSGIVATGGGGWLKTGNL